MQSQSKSFIVFAVVLPLAFALIAAGAVVIPRIFGKPPAFDFVYATNVQSYGRYELAVRDGHVELNTRNCPSNCSYSDSPPQLFHYSAATQRSTALTLEQARQLNLDPSERSPDGYRFTRDTARGGLFVFPVYDYGFANSLMYLVGPGGRFEVNLAQNGSPIGGGYYYNSYNTRLIGWIIKGDA